MIYFSFDSVTEGGEAVLTLLIFNFLIKNKPQQLVEYIQHICVHYTQFSPQNMSI